MGVEEVDERGLFVGKVAPEVIDGVKGLVEGCESTRWDQSDSAGKRPGRSTMNFGWDFVKLEEGVKVWREVPKEVDALRKEIYGMFAEHSTDAKAGHLTSPESLDNIIITIYSEGDSIVPHYDRAEDPKRLFYFGDSVFGVVVRPDSTGKGIFWQKETSSPGASLTMNQISPEIAPPEVPGMAFMMQSTMRNWPYYHGVIPVTDLRISVTMRVTIFKEGMKEG